MFSSTLSTLIVLSMSYNQIVLGQSTNTSSTGSSAAGSSSGGTSSALGLAAGLSPGCQAAAGGLLTSEFGTCSNIMGLVSVIGASGSIIAPLTTWISGVCTAAPCSSDTLKQASQSVNNGCSSDIQKGSGIAMALQMIVGNLQRSKYTSNSTFCIPSILGNVESASGQNITISQVTSILSGSMTPASQALANVPSGTYCTDCGHALVTQSAAFMASSGASSSNSTNSFQRPRRFQDRRHRRQNAAGRQVGSILLVAPIALVTFSLSLLA
ncbi:hypothetical protein PSTT_00121 [Puccinia striiformis]|uniref:Secreted protein n=1 Tax=Puccinia striiformis TaxID=27350 RepID=A0A2S4W8G4_9BASI|nr:hypothetical protein PSTT_00121 [Puccinia striiformis]